MVGEIRPSFENISWSWWTLSRSALFGYFCCFYFLLTCFIAWFSVRM